MKKTPFTGFRFYECSITGPGYEGFILSDISIRVFEAVANEYGRKTSKYSPEELAGLICKQGNFAEHIKQVDIDFLELKKGNLPTNAPGNVLGKYFIYSIIVDENELPNEHPLDWQGLLATDAPVSVFAELMKQYALNYRSRKRSDIEAYLIGNGYFAVWLKGNLVRLRV